MRLGHPNTKLIAALAAVALLAIVATTAWAATTKYPTIFTEFKLKTNSSGGKFKGQIDSTKSKCVNGRQVKLFRTHNGNQKKLGQRQDRQQGQVLDRHLGKAEERLLLLEGLEEGLRQRQEGLRGRHLEEIKISS